MKPALTPINEPNNIYGYEAESSLGFTVQVVKCYENEWNVFLVNEKGRVIARSIEEYRACGDGYLTRRDAFRIGRTLL